MELQSKWGAGGKYRIVLNAVLAGTAGNVSGGVGQMLQAGAVNYFQSLSASEVKKIADALGRDADAAPGSASRTNPGAEAARAALHAIVGCAGEAASSTACGAGALGAAAGSVINSVLGGDTQAMSPQEKEDRRNLVASIVEGIALITGKNIASATSSAVVETEKNYLLPSEINEYVAAQQRLKNCKEAQCELDAKADIVRLEKASYDRYAGAVGGCKDKFSCSVQIADIAEDLAALQEFAKDATGLQADIVKAQIHAAQKYYDSMLLNVQQIAADELGRSFQTVSDEQLISGEYLTAAQVASLRESEAGTNKKMLDLAIEFVMAVMTEGVGRASRRQKGKSRLPSEASKTVHWTAMRWADRWGAIARQTQ
ncbi:hypothetical protein BOSP111201_04010 [Bordetella sputigena]